MTKEIRDFYEGWKPRSIKVEPPSPEAAAKFISIIKLLKPWAAAFWINELSKTHRDRVAAAYSFVLDKCIAGLVCTPYHMTAMLTKDEIRAFKSLYLANATKEQLYCGASVLALRERFMFASAILKSLKG